MSPGTTGAAWEPAPARPFGRPDLYVALVLFVGSWILASLYLPAFRAGGGVPQFYQEDFAPAVLSACGRGYVNLDARAIPPLADFLSTRSNTFSCRDLPEQITPVPLGLMPSVCRYLMLASAGVWRVTGVSWTSLDILLSTMFAVAIAAGYLALRFVAGPALAAIGALFWAVSPMHLANLPHLRDYSKAPFFALTALAAAFVITQRRARWLVITGLLFGAVQGIGFGMRTDTILNFAPFFTALFLAGARAVRDQIVPKITTAVAALAAFAIIAQPMFGTYGSSDGLSKIALLGLTTPFDQALSVRRGPYDFGSLYNDSYVSAEVSGDWNRRHHRTGGEVRGPMFADASRDYYERLALRFPGDMLTRTAGAIVQTLNLPFTISYGAAPWGVTNRILTSLAGVRSKIVLLLIGTGPLVAALLLFLVGWSRLRDALVAFVALMLLTAYPVIQFHGRHTFHLEFVVIALFVWLASLAVRSGRQLLYGRRPPTMAVLRSGAFIASVIAGAVAVMWSARAVQTPGTRAMLDRYDAAAHESLTLSPTPLTGGRMLLAADVFDRPGPFEQQALVVADILPAGCPHPPEAITLRYLPSGDLPASEYDFSTQVMLPAAADPRKATRVFAPVFAIDDGRGDAARFAGVEVSAGAAGCVRLSRVRGLDDELWLDATLTPGWRQEALYSRLYIGPLFPERVWLRLAHWWPSFAALG